MKIIVKKTSKMLEIEQASGVSIEETLRRLYVDEDLSLKQICNQLGISYVTTVNWLKLAGIRSRRLRVDS